MPVEIHLSGEDLVLPVIEDLCAAGASPAAAIARALQNQLFDRVSTEFGGRLCKPPVIRPDLHPGKCAAATLPQLARKGWDVWYPEVRFSTSPGDVVEDVLVHATGIELIPIDYGRGVHQSFLLRAKALKRQVNHVLRINHVRVPGQFFDRVLAVVDGAGRIEQPLLANFKPGPDISGYRVVSYDNMITGARAFCSCSRALHQDLLKRCRDKLPSYVPGSWPHELAGLLEAAAYSDAICHLCLAKAKSPEEAAQFYGSSVEEGFESFVDQVAFDENMDAKTARQEVKRVLGLSRWVREAQLFSVIREIFPDQRVLREASPDWLGRMRLDIYMPDLAVAIEHQGEQHYRPISVFGGAESYSRLQERDALKRALCAKNGVEVVDVRFDAPISKAAITRRLQRYINQEAQLGTTDRTE